LPTMIRIHCVGSENIGVLAVTMHVTMCRIVLGNTWQYGSNPSKGNPYYRQGPCHVDNLLIC